MKLNNIPEIIHNNYTSLNETKRECLYQNSYISPWTTFASLGLLYILALTWYYKSLLLYNFLILLNLKKKI